MIQRQASPPLVQIIYHNVHLESIPEVEFSPYFYIKTGIMKLFYLKKKELRKILALLVLPPNNCYES